MAAPAFAFRPMTIADIPMVAGWTETPPVREWWIEADGSPAQPVDEKWLAAADSRQWIVQLGDTPLGFIQDYDPHAWPGHHFAYLPPGARGIDQFIGIPTRIRRGYGSRFIALFVRKLFAQGVVAVGTDPNPDNARAICAYEKAGFVRRQTVTTDWGPAALMKARPN